MSHSIPDCDAKESLREGNMRMGFQTQLILRQLFSLISDGFKSWTNSKFAAYLYGFLCKVLRLELGSETSFPFRKL